MNTPENYHALPPHFTLSDLERATSSWPGLPTDRYLACHDEDCLIATHEFDTSPPVEPQVSSWLDSEFSAS